MRQTQKKCCGKLSAKNNNFYATAQPNKSLDVKTRTATLYERRSLNLNLLAFGFAPRRLNRSAFSNFYSI